MNKFTLADLEQRVSDRANAPAEQSYTRQLLDKGTPQCAKKFGEEAVEAVLAAIAEDREHMIGEAADVLYHLLVLLEVTGVPFAAVKEELKRRTAETGLEEKARRTDA